MGLPLFSSYPDSPCDNSSAMATHSSAAASALARHAEQARRMALQLSDRRKAIDDEIAEQGEVLKSNDASLNSALIDPDGFPISTIDIVAVRTARSRIIALRNDRAAIEGEMRDLIDVALARPEQRAASSAEAPPVTASTRLNGAGGSTSLSNDVAAAMAQVPGTQGAMSMSVPVRHGDQAAWSEIGGLSAFARVNSVALNSPAARADVRVGDEVLQFGHLTTATAHRSATQRDLANLPEAVRAGAEISVVVLRQQIGGQDTERTVKRLRVTPASGWGGRGLLGCHLVPL